MRESASTPQVVRDDDGPVVVWPDPSPLASWWNAVMSEGTRERGSAASGRSERAAS
ncbi:hypothetical protein [Nocardia arizonensis]|uniref:hypothetical protein n=1 Tax=Nocardia arizonensis TaxID=1141647 RepID=UPI000A661768|nr:hypothetical protein [Nocardia arizonensis]